MTLSTNVYVLDPCDPHELFAFCQTLVNPDGRTDIRHEDRPASYGGPGIYRIANEIGQGLCAILDVTYRPDGPVRAYAGEHDVDCEPDCDGEYHQPAHCLDVDFDTAYGYQDEHGGCGHLHARIVAALGAWLDAKGVRWSWRNEFTGEVWGGDDRYARLVDLAGGGAEAESWFRRIMPAITAGMAER